MDLTNITVFQLFATNLRRARAVSLDRLGLESWTDETAAFPQEGLMDQHR